MTHNGYARPAAPVKLTSYLVRLHGMPPRRLLMTHRALLDFLRQVERRRVA